MISEKDGIKKSSVLANISLNPFQGVGQMETIEKVVTVGCDLHDKTMLLQTAVGRSAAEKSTVVNSAFGRKAMIFQLKAKAEKNGAGRIVFAYEASGLGFNLYDELTEAGIECHVLAPTKIARSAKQKRSKCDEKDAQHILEMLRAFVLAGVHLPAVWIPSHQIRDDRELTRARSDLATKLSKIKTQVRCLLKRNGVQKPSELGKGWTKGYRTWLKTISVKGQVLETGAMAALGSLMRQYEHLIKEIKVLDKKLAVLATVDRYTKQVEAITKLNGVGVLCALIFLTEMGELSRFKNRRQVGAYVGLVPCSFETGETNDRKGHITKQGSSHTRRVLNQCVWSRIRTDPEEAEFYARVNKKNPKKKKISVVALMRRLAVKMWHAGLNASMATSEN